MKKLLIVFILPLLINCTPEDDICICEKTTYKNDIKLKTEYIKCSPDYIKNVKVVIDLDTYYKIECK